MIVTQREAVSIALQAIELQMEQHVKDRTVTQEYEDYAKARKVLREMMTKEIV